MFDRSGRRKYPNDSERKAFLRVVKTLSSAIEKSFCLTLFYSGCRISEALKLSRERLDVQDATLIFETLKQRKRRQFRAVPIPNDLVRLLSGRSRTGRIWKFSRTTGYRIVKKCMAEAGIIGAMANPKGLRHGFAVACLENKIPLTIVQKWMGHRRLETTAIYLNVSGKEERDLAKRLWASD